MLCQQRLVPPSQPGQSALSLSTKSILPEPLVLWSTKAMFRYLVLMGSLKKSPSVRLVRSIVYIEYVRYINNNFFNKSRKARYGNVYVILGVLSSRLKKVEGRIPIWQPAAASVWTQSLTLLQFFLTQLLWQITCQNHHQGTMIYHHRRPSLKKILQLEKCYRKRLVRSRNEGELWRLTWCIAVGGKKDR